MWSVQNVHAEPWGATRGGSPVDPAEADTPTRGRAALSHLEMTRVSLGKERTPKQRHTCSMKMDAPQAHAPGPTSPMRAAPGKEVGHEGTEAVTLRNRQTGHGTEKSQRPSPLGQGSDSKGRGGRRAPRDVSFLHLGTGWAHVIGWQLFGGLCILRTGRFPLSLS